jgi:hypothetical protein
LPWRPLPTQACPPTSPQCAERSVGYSTAADQTVPGTAAITHTPKPTVTGISRRPKMLSRQRKYLSRSSSWRQREKVCRRPFRLIESRTVGSASIASTIESLLSWPVYRSWRFSPVPQARLGRSSQPICAMCASPPPLHVPVEAAIDTSPCRHLISPVP